MAAVVLLFLVLDPLGNVPLFVSILARVQQRRRTVVLIRELLIALVVLVAFCLAGPFAVRLLGLTNPALTIAGGIILFLIALRMIFPSPGWVLDENEVEDPLLVPLAIPLIAGPSALSTVLLLVAREPGSLLKWLAAVVIAWALSAIILLFSTAFSRLWGTRSLIALERLMGMILTAVAVQMFLTGLLASLAR